MSAAVNAAMNIVYDRSEHQPLCPPPVQPDPAPEQLRAACGATAALVLALEGGTTPLKVTFDDPDVEPVECGAAPADDTPRPLQCFEGVPVVVHAMRCACAAQVACVHVLAASERTVRVVRRAVAEMDACGEAHPPVSCEVLSAADAERMRVKTGNFELCGVPAAALAAGARVLEGNPSFRALLVMSCDQVRLRSRHILALHERMNACPQARVVTSWIQWLRRTPLLLRREFACGVLGSALCRPRAGAPWRPLPNLAVEEVVFGEEKLAANPVVPVAREKFAKENALSALEAVRLARKMKREEAKHAAKGNAVSPCSEVVRPSLCGVPSSAAKADDPLCGLSDADKLLVRLARETIDGLDVALAGDRRFFARLANVDTWAHRVKHAFPIFSDRRHKNRFVYLDSAATSQRLGCALDAQARFDRGENANIYRGCYELSAQATASFNEARKIVEDFIGADRRQTVFVENTTAACNLVATAWGEHNVGAGDLIVATLAEHHSNLLPWLLLSRRVGADLAYVPLLADGRIDQQAYDELLARKPKLVCLAHISNVLGLVNPVEDMARRAHAVGARVLVDAAQSVPHVSLDVKQLGADFVAFSGHKLYAPYGIGCLWIAPEAFEEMDPVGSGGGAISHVGRQSYYLRQGAIQNELGTPAISQAIALAQAVEYLDELGLESVIEHDRVLTEYLMAGLRRLDNVVVWGDHDCVEGQTGLVALSVANMESAQVGSLLGQMGVAVRSGGHCALPLAASMGVTGTTRVSFGIHTTREDVEAVLVALRLCGELYATCEVMGQGAEDEAKAMETNVTGTDVVGTEGVADAAVPTDVDAAVSIGAGAAVSEGIAAVERHYAEVAEEVLGALDAGALCGRSSCCDEVAAASEVALYAREVADALPAGACAASRGCGDPMAQAGIASGEVVCDLGSGGGIDALIAARLVGSTGRVYDVDMTDEMIQLARRNAQEASCANVEFLKGRIEDIPLPDASVVVVISNCVINLADDKQAVLREVCRILRPGGRLVVSDIVTFASVPEGARSALGRITGAVRGMVSVAAYQGMLHDAGFSGVRVEPKTVYTLEVLRRKAARKGRETAFAELAAYPEVDGASGSAIVRAVKAPGCVDA